VQIGPEMRDDTVVVNALDEDTPRHQIVESIRQLLGEEKLRGHKNIQDPQTRKTIQSLFDRLVKEQPEQILKASEAMLVRRCFEKLHETTRGERIHILRDDGESYQDVVRFATLIENVRLRDNRLVDLTLIKPFNSQKDDYLDLVAIARGNIALPIARMFKDAGNIVFSEEKANMSSAQQKLIFDALMALIREKPLVSFYDTPEGYGIRANRNNAINPNWQTADPGSLNYCDAVCATYMHERGLLRKDEGALQGGKYDHRTGMTREGVDEIYKRLDAYFADSDHLELPYGNLAPVKLAMSRLPELRRAQQQIFDLFNTQARFQEKIGRSNLEEERLGILISKMWQRGKEFWGVIKNANTGKTMGDLEVKAIIENSGTSFIISIFAKPHAMTTKEFSGKPQMTLTFDAAKPIFDSVDDAEATSQARKYYEILKQLDSTVVVATK
jgi:hypothetical protein